MHPDRDYYPTQLQNLWGAPNWGLKFSNLWLSCVDKFQAKSGSSLSVWLWFKRDETLANSSIKQSTQQSKAKPSKAKAQGKKKNKERGPKSEPEKKTWCLVLKDVLLAWRIYPSSLLRWRCACLVLKDVLLAWRIYRSSLLRWRYALHALFICSSSHSHHRHYACTLPLSKSVPVLLDSFDFEKNLQFWFLFGGFTEDRTSFAV